MAESSFDFGWDDDFEDEYDDCMGMDVEEDDWFDDDDCYWDDWDNWDEDFFPDYD